MTRSNPIVIPRPILGAVAGLLIAGAAQIAHAQVGSGWTEFFPSSFLDVQSGGNHTHYPVANLTVDGVKYTISGNLETYELTSTASNRLERRHDEHYTSGARQMQGDIKISGISQQSVHQLFYGTSGPQIMITGYGADGGTLRKQGGSVTLISGINGVWVRYNLINIVGNTMQVYINGSLKWSGGSPSGGGGYNNKYGLYGTKVTPAPVVQWRNVKHFRDGQAGGSIGTQTFEAEHLQVDSTSGESVQLQTDSNCSGGQAIQFNSNGVNDYITFRLPNVPAGAYTLSVRVKEYTPRGIVQTICNAAGGALDDSRAIGSPMDWYNSSSIYTTFTVGTWTVGSSDKHVRFKVTGKNASSSGYNMFIDYIRITPQ